MGSNPNASAELYRRTEFGWPVLVIVLCLLAFMQAVSVVTHEPQGMLHTIDSVLLLVTLPFYAMTIRVSPATINWSLLFGLFPQRLLVASIQTVQEISLSPIDGYGVRGDGGRKLWRVSGSKAIIMKLADECVVGLGTTNPAALMTAIERARSLEKKT